jgi:hypothetical protein
VKDQIGWEPRLTGHLPAMPAFSRTVSISRADASMLSGPPHGLSKWAPTNPSIFKRSGERIASAIAHWSSTSPLASISPLGVDFAPGVAINHDSNTLALGRYLGHLSIPWVYVKLHLLFGLQCMPGTCGDCQARGSSYRAYHTLCTVCRIHYNNRGSSLLSDTGSAGTTIVIRGRLRMMARSVTE